jgi:hypothetical protein
MPVWLKPVAGLQAVVLWQFPHSDVVAMWVAGLPAAVVPLWQLEQLPRTCAWSTRIAGFHALVEWQASHITVVNMCVAFLPAAFTPSWQLEQFVVMPAWLKVAGFHARVE